MRRIAVFNTAFLGDAVLTLPLVQSLRLRYPEAVIDFYVRGGLRGLFAPHPAVSTVYDYDKRGANRGLSGFARLAREIASRRYDLWISAHASPRSGALALASGAPLRIGYTKPLLNRIVYTHCVDRGFGRRDEIERLLALLEPLGQGPVSVWPELALSEEAKQAAAVFFSRLRRPVLGLHPGSVWGTKRWPVGAFADMGRRALDSGAEVALFAGPGEEEVAASVREQIESAVSSVLRGRLHSLAGKLALPELAAYIAGLSCYLTNDSGPMHLAWVQRVPVTAVFGPTVRSLGFFPRGSGAAVFEADVSCRPCGLHGPAECPLGHHHCMTRIDRDAVWRDIQDKLRK